jgi:hypothetical protein
MLGMLRKRWRELRAGRPGSRFQERFERMRGRSREHGTLRKCLIVAGGLALVLAGIVFLPMPGPGMLIIALGGVMLAERSRTAARALDWLELKLRSLVPGERL